MSETLCEEVLLAEAPDIDHLITEDDTPVDNIFSEKQQRLLVEPLYLSWHPEQPFVAVANLGIFHSVHEPPIVPDMFLSLNVQVAEDLWAKQHRAYFLWEFGKPPEVVVEIVSNKRGGEIDKKLRTYTRIGVWYYLIFDPQCLIQEEQLRIYEIMLGRHRVKSDRDLKPIDLSVTLWEGEFEGSRNLWLRWCDAQGNLIPTGVEQSLAERQRAEQEYQRAEQERQYAERERRRAERLAAQLRALGVEPTNGGNGEGA